MLPADRRNCPVSLRAGAERQIHHKRTRPAADRVEAGAEFTRRNALHHCGDAASRRPEAVRSGMMARARPQGPPSPRPPSAKLARRPSSAAPPPDEALVFGSELMSASEIIARRRHSGALGDRRYDARCCSIVVLVIADDGELSALADDQQR